MKEELKHEYLKYRIEKSHETLKAAKVLADSELWVSVINRLYYSCFYIVSALLYSNDIHSKTHQGLKTVFFEKFVKTK